MADADVVDYLEWFYRTGMRPKEIKSLTWAAFDRETWALTLPAKDAKIGKPRTLPLRAEWREIIERRIKARTIEGQDGKSTVAEYIFHRGGRRMGEFRKAWRTACAKAGLRAGRKVEGGKTPYDRRRTAVRNMVRGGTRENVAMAISGHRTRAVFDRYDIVDERDLADAVEKTSVYVASLLTASNVVPLRAVAEGSAR